MTAWLCTYGRQSGTTASGFVTQARRLRTLPITDAAALDGTLSADQIKAVLGAVSARTEHLYPTRMLAQRRADALVDVARWFLEHRDDGRTLISRPLPIVGTLDLEGA